MNLPNGQKKAENSRKTEEDTRTLKPGDKKYTIIMTKQGAEFSFFIGVFFIILGTIFTIIMPGFAKLIAILFIYNGVKILMMASNQLKEAGDTVPEEKTQEQIDKESTESRLKSLRQLYDDRLITTQEYEQKREEILKDL